MKPLTLQRLFSEPDINGPTPQQIKCSPDNRRVTFLQALPDDRDQLHLFEFDREQRSSKLLINAQDLVAGELSEADKARRERLRIAHGGIVDYQWSPDGLSILVPMSGSLYLFDLASRAARLLLDDDYATDVTFSPCGAYLAMVINNDLWCLDIASGLRTQLTHDGSDTICNGRAEFIAQEEMHRYEGYWWSPDSRQIAFFQVDESPVNVTQRYEIAADKFGVFDQRYPYAGEANASVRLGLVDRERNDVEFTEIESGDGYLARLGWLDNDTLLVVRQNRLQNQLSLLRFTPGTRQCIELLNETSTSWINLNDDMKALADGSGFLWNSSRSGYPHLYHYTRDGELVRQLTSGAWCTDGVRAVTDEHIYFEGFKDTPLERHLYRVSHEGSAPERLTCTDHFHNTTVAADGSFFVDRQSNSGTPVTVTVVTNGVSAPLPLIQNEERHPMADYLPSSPDQEASFGILNAEDGQDLHYRLLPPAEVKPGVRYPVIVLVYGGPGAQLVTNSWLSPWQRYMSQQGYGLFQLDNRGSANRGDAFEGAIHQHMGDAEVRDQLVGLAFLKELDWVDTNRIGVFGHSYGGYMTLMMLFKAPTDYCCGVSVAPVSDWRLYDTHYTERYLGLPADNPRGYEQSAVFPFLPELKAPLLLIHGMADDNVLYTHSTRLYKALQDENLAFDVMAYPGAKHGLTGRSINLHRYALMDRFFATHMDNSA